jgi:hypothetical protein
VGYLARIGIHPSIYRQQLQVYAKNITQSIQHGHLELSNNARARLKDFRERYAPWTPDPQLSGDLRHPTNPGNLILEKVAREYVLYPSTNPGKVLFFHSRDEALNYAKRHFASCEIDVPVQAILTPEIACEIYNTFCC